ncbi:MAG: glycosyltransferase [bacterium]
METHLYDLCMHLKSNFDINVLVANTEPKTVTEMIDGVRVTRLANWGELFSTPICPTFPHHIKQLDGCENTIIHMHLPNPMAHISYLLAKPKGKLLVEWHSDIVRQRRLSRLYEKFLFKLLERANRIVATSPNYVEHSLFLSKFRDKCVIVPLGISLGKFRTSSRVRKGAEEIRRVSREKIVLFVGRLTYYKGLDVLLSAATDIAGRIIIVGDGPLRQHLRDQIKRLRLDNKVFMKHDVDNEELVALYHACDVFVLPSNERSEAFGLVQLEAMACGKPVVSTNLETGVPWVNQHEVTGLVVPVNDATSLASALNIILGDKNKREQYGRNALQRVVQNFSLDSINKQMEGVFDEILTTT